MTQQEMQTRAADRLWADYALTRDPRTRDALVQQFECLAYSIANRFARRGTDDEDLLQVARMGLVKAVDRFDPHTCYRFSTFATPTILGELKRYFRDHSRVVHVPRGMQDLAVRVQRSGRELTQRLGRPPTPAEIADHLDVAEERVQEALTLEEVSCPRSLDSRVESGEAGERLGVLERCLGSEDTGLEEAEHRVMARQALRNLCEPLRRIIHLRYFAELSQREVARRLGLSQMKVCRMEKRALRQLRSHFAVH